MLYLILLLTCVACVASGVFILIATAGTEWHDPSTHTFKPDSRFGPAARCKVWVEGNEPGTRERCALPWRVHKEVYGDG